MHTRAVEQRRGTATSRGYDSYWSKVFRPWFFRQLIAADVPPVCGGALPGGPSMDYSVCKAQGLQTFGSLHLDHEPPLQDHERGVRRAVCDATRVGLLCQRCHNRKTQREQQAGAA